MIRFLVAASVALVALIVGIGLGGVMSARSVDAASAYAATSTTWMTSTATVSPTTARRTAQVTVTHTTTATRTAVVTQLNTVTPTPQYADRAYSSCGEARAAGAVPLRRDEPGYSRKLDRDGDGTACET